MKIIQEYCWNQQVFIFYATANGKGAPDSLGADGKAFIYRKEVCGTARCADAWEVFCTLTHGVDGMPQPRHVVDYTKKKQFQLDSRTNRFKITEDKVTTEMKSRIGNDVHYVRKMSDGHRENSLPLNGCRKLLYELRATSDSNGFIHTRETVCCCTNCVISNYEQCLTGSVWKVVNCSVAPENDVNRMSRLAHFYHLIFWDKDWYRPEHIPLVAFSSKDGELELGILKSKPYQLQDSLLKQNQKGNKFIFKATKQEW